MTETITISGHPFTVPSPYAEGHVLNANEASALNQTYHENLRNNFAKRVKEGQETGIGLDVLQQQLNDYAQTYSFGVRTGGGGGSRDPVKSEAMDIAREKIKDALKNAGKKVADYKASVISAAAEKLLAGPNGQAILDLAKQRVSERQAIAGDDLDSILAGIPATPAATPQADAPASSDEPQAA